MYKTTLWTYDHQIKNNFPINSLLSIQCMGCSMRILWSWRGKPSTTQNGCPRLNYCNCQKNRNKVQMIVTIEGGVRVRGFRHDGRPRLQLIDDISPYLLESSLTIYEDDVTDPSWPLGTHHTHVGYLCLCINGEHKIYIQMCINSSTELWLILRELLLNENIPINRL